MTIIYLSPPPPPSILGGHGGNKIIRKVYRPMKYLTRNYHNGRTWDEGSRNSNHWTKLGQYRIKYFVFVLLLLLVFCWGMGVSAEVHTPWEHDNHYKFTDFSSLTTNIKFTKSTLLFPQMIIESSFNQLAELPFLLSTAMCWASWRRRASCPKRCNVWWS